MSQDRKHSIQRIGRSIYPLRVFGFLLFSISVLLSHSKLALPHDAWSIAGITMAIVYPHIAFLRYVKNEERETEISHMQLDMVLMGILIALVCFNPVIALPYLIANSSANFALRGMKQVIQGLALVFVPALLIGVFRTNEIMLKIDVTELIAPFLYLTVVTHYMGYLAYIRGISLIRRKKKAEEIAQIDFLTGLNNRRSMFEKIKINDTNSKPKDPDTTFPSIPA